jgi:hypothetical protein
VQLPESFSIVTVTGEYGPESEHVLGLVAVMYDTAVALVVATSVNVLRQGAEAGAPVNVTAGLPRVAIVDCVTGVAAE